MQLIILILQEITIQELMDSKFLTLQNRTLTDFTRCKTNRVLLHDDISDGFSSEGFESLLQLLNH